MLSKEVQFDLRALGKPRCRAKSNGSSRLLRTKFTDYQVELTLIMRAVRLSRPGHLLLESILFLFPSMDHHGFVQSTVLGGMKPCVKTGTKVGNHQAPELVVMMPHCSGKPVTFRVFPIRCGSSGWTGRLPIVLGPMTELLYRSDQVGQSMCSRAWA